MDRGSTEVEIHCACAWEPGYICKPIPFSDHRERKMVQCRAHMEAQITKQGQAAGAVDHRDSQSPASPANANVDAKQASQ